jgi:type IV pilus assembly protein PilO
VNTQMEKIFELSLPKKLGILFACTGLIGGGYWFMFYSSTINEMAAVTADVDKMKSEIAEKQVIAANLPQFEGEVERLDDELVKALAELPDKKEVDEILDKISDKARDAGLDVRLFKPQAEQKKDFYAEVPVEIEIGGTYHQIATFFDEVGQMERIVNIDQFSLVQPQETDGKIQINASVVATSFRFLDESERPKQNKEGEAGKSKKKKKKKVEE